eukprot:TRINITY_DN544_c0_g1_i1.p1 TRINITY_DN544_c0_g1~~TRINITY_DN544_c0_g1_i1.p1  ORF type:complete len:148 (-),score=27.23 TRINITY_DN544_c0_g1_i1:96-539(-)
MLLNVVVFSSVCTFFFFNDTATTEIYTILFVGSVRCVQETGIMEGSQQFQSLAQYLISRKLAADSLTMENATVVAIAILCMPNISHDHSKRNYIVKCLTSILSSKKENAKAGAMSDEGIKKVDHPEEGKKILMIAGVINKKMMNIKE